MITDLLHHRHHLIKLPSPIVDRNKYDSDPDVALQVIPASATHNNQVCVLLGLPMIAVNVPHTFMITETDLVAIV